MGKAIKIKENLYWVGSLDPNARIFDIVMYTKYGTTYNSFIYKTSEKTILVEVTKDGFFDDYLERIKDITDPSKIDYLIVNHTEPDHSGSVYKLLEINPDITIVGSSTAVKYLENIINMPFKSIVVKDKDTLDIGDGKKLEFILAPFLHWPDSMFTYLESEKVLFTCDFLGCHYCSDNPVNTPLNDDFEDSFKYYYDVIMAPFKPFVLSALTKIEQLDVDYICNGHGPILHSDIQKYKNLYKKWSTPVEKQSASVVVAYTSSYGYTKKIAMIIAQGIQSHNKTNVCLYDIADTNTEIILRHIQDADGLLIGSPTLVGDTLPNVWDLMAHLNPFINKGLITGTFGSYGWSGEATKNIEERFKQLRFKIPFPAFKVIFNPSDKDLDDAFAYGKQFAESLK